MYAFFSYSRCEILFVGVHHPRVDGPALSPHPHLSQWALRSRIQVGEETRHHALRKSPTNITSVTLVMGYPNARAGAKRPLYSNPNFDPTTPLWHSR